MYRILTVIFNSISSSHNVPLHFSKATIVPIPKGRDYRGITLLSVIGKVYEKLLLEWFDLNSNIPVNELQGAYRKGSSSVDVAFNLHKTVTNIQDPDSSVYLCLLDARQAFDTVWYQGLFHKLARGVVTNICGVLCGSITRASSVLF